MAGVFFLKKKNTNFLERRRVSPANVQILSSAKPKKAKGPAVAGFPSPFFSEHHE